jgi:hypothetical protein
MGPGPDGAGRLRPAGSRHVRSDVASVMSTTRKARAFAWFVVVLLVLTLVATLLLDSSAA